MSGALDQAGATELGQRIVNACRPTPPLIDWVEALTGLNHERAWRIFRQLRDTSPNGLNCATFVTAYDDDLERERRARNPQPAATVLLPPDLHCRTCDGTGYVECTDDRRHRPTCPNPDTCTCHAVIPCTRCRGAA